MLVAAIGCNIAWGFVDGVMNVLRNLWKSSSSRWADEGGQAQPATCRSMAPKKSIAVLVFGSCLAPSAMPRSAR